MRKMFMILLCMASISLNATTYYVATNGNNSYPGTYAQPFLTLQKGADVAVAGDVVILKDGTYQSTSTNMVYMTTSGSEGLPITFKSENKWGAVLDGVETGQYCIVTIGSYINIQDFEIKNFRNISIITNDISNITHHVTIEGCKIHDIGRYSTESAYGLVGIYIGRGGNSYWTIQRNLFYNIGRTGPDDYYFNKDHAIYLSSESPYSSHINIYYNIIYGCSGQALDLAGSYINVYNNTIAWPTINSEGDVYFISSIDCTYLNIRNNMFYEPVATYVIWTWDSCVGWNVSDNMIYGGRMWVPGTYDANKAAAMKGGNYGQTDCENSQTDPLMVHAVYEDLPTADFHLQSISPAINEGYNVGLTTDYSGNPISGLPDIGALEYVSPQHGKYIFSNGKMVFSNNKAVIQ